MDEREKLKAALRAQLGAAAANLDLDAIAAATLAASAPAVADAPRADGFYLLYQKRDGQYLSVHAPGSGGAPVPLAEVFDDLERKCIFTVNREEVAEQVRRADGRPRRISTYIDTFVNLGTEISVKVAADEMSASVTVPQGLWPDCATTVRVLLGEEKVTYGISEGKLAALAGLVGSEPVIVRNTVIARGTPPTRGQTARLRYEFDTRTERVPLRLPDGRVNHYQLNLIKNVHKDQTLAVKFPPALGEPGMTVRGQAVPPLRGRDVKLSAGNNVRVTADGLKLYAAASGHAHGDASVVSVDTVYTVAGDVDYATGNISIDGAVVVTGWVRTGFTVEASGDIEILGGVEGAAVTSRGGSICVHGGVLGGGRARLEARYDIIAHHVESAWLAARRHIKVAEALLHSLTLAGGSVQVFAGKGTIIGGIVRARGSILARVVGGEAGARTELRIEHSEGQALRDELDLIEKKLAQLESERRALGRVASSRMGARAAQGDGAAAEHAFAELVQSSDLETKLRLFEARREELRRGLKLPERANIKIKDVLYPGTLVSFAGRNLAIGERYQFVTFYLRDDEIRFLPFAE